MDQKVTVSNTLSVSMDSEKLYITSAEGQEVFALRSLNGIGVTHDLKGHEEAKTQASATKATGWITAGLGLLFGYIGIEALGTESGLMEGGIMVLIGVGMALAKGKDPVMKSSISLTISGAPKEFVWENSSYPDVPKDVADFVSTVQDTLTAYQKGG